MTNEAASIELQTKLKQTIELFQYQSINSFRIKYDWKWKPFNIL